MTICKFSNLNSLLYWIFTRFGKVHTGKNMFEFFLWQKCTVRTGTGELRIILLARTPTDALLPSCSWPVKTTSKRSMFCWLIRFRISSRSIPASMVRSRSFTNPAWAMPLIHLVGRRCLNLISGVLRDLMQRLGKILQVRGIDQVHQFQFSPVTLNQPRSLFECCRGARGKISCE